MNSIFYHADCFKTPLTYRVNGQRSFFTKFGCLMSIPLLGFLFAVLAVSDLVQKLHPSITIQSAVEKTHPTLVFNKSNMTLAIRVTSQDLIAEIDPSYYSISISNVFVNNTSDRIMTTKMKETKVCNENDFSDKNIFEKYRIFNSTCILSDGNFEIGGSSTDSSFSYLRILVNPCQNDSKNDFTCKSSEEIKKYLKNRVLYVYYHNRNFDLNNYKNPNSVTYASQYQFIDTNIQKKMNIFFQKVDIISDEGFFLEENILTESFVFEKIENDFTTDNSGTFFEIRIFGSRETQIMTRRYERVIKVLANLGGISYFMVFLEYFLVMTVREYCLMSHLINFLYSFPLKKTSGKKNKKKLNLIRRSRTETRIHETLINFCPKIPENQIPEVTINFYPKIHDEAKINMKTLPKDSVEVPRFSLRETNYIYPKKIADEISDMRSVENECLETAKEKSKKSEFGTFERFADFQQHEQKDKKIKISFWEYYKIKLATCFPCFKMNQRQRKFMKAQRKALEEMDFFMILRKLQEVEKLKHVLLSPEQIKLFNLSSKPMIFDEKDICDEIKKEDGFKMSQLIEKSLIVSPGNGMKEIVDYYKKIRQNKSSKVDERLLILVEESMKWFSNHFQKDLAN